MREEESDLSFAEALGTKTNGDQASPDVSIRLRLREADFETWAKYATSLVGRPGLEPGTNGLKADHNRAIPSS